MKKLILYLAAMLFIFGSCKKTNTTPPQQGMLMGGYGLDNIAGLFNITLLKNSDTTIAMPIKVYAGIDGNYAPGITINFGPLPKDIVSPLPGPYASSASIAIPYIIDSVIFQIHAIDTGTFPITVFASCNGGNPSKLSDSFNIIVH